MLPLLNHRQRGPPPAYVTVKMPYEMSDNYVTDVLGKYGRVSKVYRRHYSFAPCTETGVRVFTVLDPYGSFHCGLEDIGYVSMSGMQESPKNAIDEVQ